MTAFEHAQAIQKFDLDTGIDPDVFNHAAERVALEPRSVRLLVTERAAQIALGYGDAHDDEKRNGSLALAAKLLLELAIPREAYATTWPHHMRAKVLNAFPAEGGTQCRVRHLTIAASLIMAEIDRLLRAEKPKTV
jgi:hypothetical protein